MSAVRISNRLRVLTVAVFASVWLVASGAPARADDTAAAARAHEAPAKRTTASLNLNNAAPPAAPTHVAGLVNAFVYTTGPQSLGFRGRVNVGKSGVYVPYYGNVDTDPIHPNVQSVAGLGYGFRSFDVSVQNGAFSAGSPAAPPPNIPGGAPPKANPSLSFSIRF